MAVTPRDAATQRRLAILLAMAMFVLVGDFIGRQRAYVLGLLGFVTSLRMIRLPDPVASSAAEGLALG